MGKEKGFALSPVTTSDMRRFLERHGYEIQAGKHKHLKFRHPTYGDVLLPLRPAQGLSHVAIKQVARAMGTEPADLVKQVR